MAGKDKDTFHSRIGRRPKQKLGNPPGTLVHVGEKKADHVRVSLIAYGPDGLAAEREATLSDCLEARATSAVVWVNVHGLHDVEAVQAVGEGFGVHPLGLEDVVNTHHRPKVEDFGDQILLVAKLLSWDDAAQRPVTEQISIVLGQGFLLTFQERPTGLLEPVRRRIREGRGRILASGADYLAYAVLDMVVDQYFVVLEGLGDRIEEIEQALSGDGGSGGIRDLHELRRELLAMRRAIWPLRDMVSILRRGDCPLFGAGTEVFLRDIHDHVVEAIETLEAFRDVLTSLLDTHLSVVSNRMNEVMKVLTLIATLFMPITFIAGVYGMNFEYMPGTEWVGGFAACMAAMAVTALAMLWYFKRKRWL